MYTVRLPHAHVCRGRYRFQLRPAKDCPPANWPPPCPSRRPRSDSPRRGRVWFRISHTGFDGRDCQGTAPVPPGHTADCDRQRARGCDQRAAGCAQFAGVPGMGAIGHGLASRDHLWCGRGPTDSPGTGVQPRVDRSTTVMMDLGGGSCELTVTQGGHIRDAVSLPLGAVRLTNEFLRHDPTRKGELKRLRGFVTREVNRITDRIASAKVKNVIATSGTAAALAAVATHLRRGAGRQRPVVSRAEMTRIAKCLARLPVAERRKIEGIGPRRAEIIVAGAAVY